MRNQSVDIETFELWLNEIADTLPDEFWNELNGGILLLPERRVSPYADSDDLFTLGEYHHHQAMGRYIVIYYGSIMEVMAGAGEAQIKERVRQTLMHEFTHHLESLAGERGLEIEDEQFIANYKSKHIRK